MTDKQINNAIKLLNKAGYAVMTEEQFESEYEESYKAGRKAALDELKDKTMTINLDDPDNLPTEGPAWEMMLAHVLDNASGDEINDRLDMDVVRQNVIDHYDVPYGCIDDYIWGRVKDICREENLPYPEFCPVAIANELTSAIKLRDKVAELTEDHQKLKLQTNEQADIITRQNAEMTCDFCKKQGERTEMLLSCRTCCTVIFSQFKGWNVVAEGK